MKKVYLVFGIVIFFANNFLFSQEIQFTSPTNNQEISGGDSYSLIPFTLTYSKEQDDVPPTSTRIEYIELFSHIGVYYDDIGNGIPTGEIEMPEDWNLAPGEYHWILVQHEKYWTGSKYEILPSCTAHVYFNLVHTIKVENNYNLDMNIDYFPENSGFEAKKLINEGLAVEAVDQEVNGVHYVWKYIGVDPSEWTIQKQGLGEESLSIYNFEVYYPKASDNNAVLKSYQRVQSPPAAPQNLAISESGDEYAFLSWTANSEPDLKEYNVYRKGGYPFVDWTAIATTDKNSYEDKEVTTTYSHGEDFFYKITAVDDYDIESGFSNTVEIEARLEKQIAKENFETKPKEYVLDSNYPNPFNPTTTISYQIPKGGQVNLKIYNSLGQEVKTLVNKFQPDGFYTVEFDASDLPSGIYIYKLTSNEFSTTKKMLLTK